MDSNRYGGTPRLRPLRDLIRILPCLQVAQLGMGAIGVLLVHAAPEMDVGEVAGDTIEALGQLIAELSAQCLMLVAASRQHLARRGATGFVAQWDGELSIATHSSRRLAERARQIAGGRAGAESMLSEIQHSA